MKKTNKNNNCFIKNSGEVSLLLIFSILLLACGESENNRTNSGSSTINNESNSENSTTNNGTSTSGGDIIKSSGILIPAGQFHSSVPNTVNPININSFVISKTPTTVEQFMACVEAGACSADHYKTYQANASEYCNYDRGEAWLNHPMNCVTQTGAQAYCVWAGGRLPTEDEWEYAATHNGTQALETTYPWGYDAPVLCTHASYYYVETSLSTHVCDGTTITYSYSDETLGTESVGTYSAGNSPLGLQDMAGNVWEWTSSIWNADSDKHMVKGGAWNYVDSGLRVSFRAIWDSNNGSDSNGFRCVADVENGNNSGNIGNENDNPNTPGNGTVNPGNSEIEFQGIMIPSGSFYSTFNDVIVNTNAFLIAKTETTVEQFKACVDAGACSSDNYDTTSTCNYNRDEAQLKARLNHPMNCVNWYGANEYCAWIGGRLPTGDEWQYAATHDGTRALETKYPWGNDAPEHCVHLSYIAYEDELLTCDGMTAIPYSLSDYLFDGIAVTAEVGTYPAGNSPLGLQDMSGSVAEWTKTLDWTNKYVLKGGAWIDGYYEGDTNWNLIVSDWDNRYLKSTDMDIGFRCIKDVK